MWHNAVSKMIWHNPMFVILVVKKPSKFSQPLWDWTGSLTQVTYEVSLLVCQESKMFINQLLTLTHPHLSWIDFCAAKCLILAFQELFQMLLKPLMFSRHFFPLLLSEGIPKFFCSFSSWAFSSFFQRISKPVGELWTFEAQLEILYGV